MLGEKQNEQESRGERKASGKVDDKGRCGRRTVSEIMLKTKRRENAMVGAGKPASTTEGDSGI